MMTAPASMPFNASDLSHRITVQRCALKRGYLVRVSQETETLDLEEAFKRFAPSGSRQAKHHVLAARPGHYLGLAKVGANRVNNVLIVPFVRNDIRFFLRKNPQIESVLTDVFLVVDVQLPKTGIDLPSIGGSSEEQLG